MASPLTKAQLDGLRRSLEEERGRILGVLNAPAATVPEARGPELEEAAQRAAERDQRLGIVARERALLVEVERALAKLDEGKYGVSEQTGAPIPYERLAALPWARSGIDE
jgi:RNA polymerase-binding transcription factor